MYQTQIKCIPQINFHLTRSQKCLRQLQHHLIQGNMWPGKLSEERDSSFNQLWFKYILQTLQNIWPCDHMASDRPCNLSFRSFKRRQESVHFGRIYIKIGKTKNYHVPYTWMTCKFMKLIKKAWGKRLFVALVMKKKKDEAWVRIVAAGVEKDQISRIFWR